MNQQLDNEPVLYTVNDIRRITGFGRDRTYSLMRSKGFPSTKIGNTFFITKKNFEDWTDNYAGKEFKM